MNAPERETPAAPGRSLTVLHVIAVAPGGGSAATARRQMLGVAARGHRVICATSPGLGWREKLSGTAVELRDELRLRRGFRPLAFLRDVRAIADLIRAEKVDIVHLHKAVGYLVGAVAAWRAGRGKVVRSRGVVFAVRPHLFNRWLHNRLTDRVIVTASAIERSYGQLAGFDASKVVLIHDGVDCAELGRTPDRAAARERFALPPGGPVVGCVARAADVKGHVHLLEAFGSVRESHPGARLFLATYAHHDNELAKLGLRVSGAGLGDAVTVHEGHFDDVRPVYAAIDLYVLASVGSEGSSRATLEAMAAGLPAVATTVGVLPDVVADGETGLLVPPGDAKALAAAITELLGDPERMRSMGEAARARASELFDESRSLDRIEAVYADLAEAAG